MEDKEPSCPDVLITAGGTREKIDDVRYIGNFSGGWLGRALAESYADLGHKVLLLAPKDAPARLGIPEGVEHRPFTSAESLRETMLSVPAARLVLHGAAVSDYTPERTEGKISSDEEELVISCRRTPKILKELRGHFGSETKIVGFKLLSGVEEHDLIDTATEQIKACCTDACVANDLQDLGQTRRLHVVSPDGDYQTVEGDTQSVANQIADALPIKEANHA